MCRLFGQGFFQVSNNDFTQTSLVCSYASLALSSTAYFGSLLLIVGIVSYDLPIKWNFIVYMVASGFLYLLNILSNSLIISTKSLAFSTENRTTSMQSSVQRNIIRESLDIQLPLIPRAEGLCQEEVQTDVETKTPPPPYEDLLDASTQSTHVSHNRPQNQEPVSQDVKELLNKILFAVNNRTYNSEQLHKTQDTNCNSCQSHVACSGRVSQENRAIPTSSEYGRYPQLPEEVLEHFSDPNAFIKALAKYQSQNREMEYEGNRKNQIENKELPHKQGFQNRVVQDLDYLTPSRQTNLMATRYESLKPTSPISKNSPSKIQQQRLKSKTQMSFEKGNSTGFLDVPMNLELPKLIRNLNSEDKSMRPTKAYQSDFSSISPEDKNFTKSKKVFQDRSSPRICRQDATFTKKKEVSQDLSLGSPRKSQITALNQIGIPVVVLDSASPTASQQDLSPKTSIFSQKDLGLTSPRILQDIESANQIGIPLKDYTLNRSESTPENSNSEESICWTNFERGQAFSTPNMPIRRARSTHALHQTTPKAIGRDNDGTESASNTYSVVDIAVKNFTKESAEYHMNPKEWLAAWSKGLNKISSKDTSTLLGSRL